jgi:murein DD-endopeptidase MepM/ murein hydrolase activator NlpD
LRSLWNGSARPGGGSSGRAKTKYAVPAILALALLAPATAAADSGGAAITPPHKGQTQPAPPSAAPRPAGRAQIADVRCTANPGGPCVDGHRANRGATVQLRGRRLANVRQVVFYGGRGAADDALGLAQSAGATKAVATVPAAALSGPIAVIDAAGKRSKRWEGLIVDTATSFSFRPASAMPSVQVGLSQPRTIFFGGMQRAIFNFEVTGDRPADVQVDLVRLSDHAVIQSWQRAGTPPGVPQRIAWNGAVRRKPQPQGRYAFRVTTPGALTSRAASSDDQEAITLIGYVFPIRGVHTFNLGAGRFGAARRGHVHQGQDVFARCGTPLVAARGGKVTYAGYHALAGYYVVINGSGTGVDFMYAHLREPPLVATGDTVYTGQQLGEVGDTGDAVGCHLHFEEWSAPGWYKGGHAYDPLPDLKRWDTPVAP